MRLPPLRTLSSVIRRGVARRARREGRNQVTLMRGVPKGKSSWASMVVRCRWAATVSGAVSRGVAGSAKARDPSGLELLRWPSAGARTDAAEPAPASKARASTASASSDPSYAAPPGYLQLVARASRGVRQERSADEQDPRGGLHGAGRTDRSASPAVASADRVRAARRSSRKACSRISRRTSPAIPSRRGRWRMSSSRKPSTCLGRHVRSRHQERQHLRQPHLRCVPRTHALEGQVKGARAGVRRLWRRWLGATRADALLHPAPTESGWSHYAD